MFKKIIIFGTSIGAEIITKNLKKSMKVIAYIDNNSKMHNTFYHDILVSKPEDIILLSYDYIIVSMLYAYDTAVKQLLQLKVSKKKIIIYFEENDKGGKNTYAEIFLKDWRYNAILYKLYEERKRENDNWKRRLENQKFEIKEQLMVDTISLPHILAIEESITKIIEEGLSVSRFGDGEFEIMRGNERPAFQKNDSALALMLREVLNSEENGHAVAIADNYGNLDCYTEAAADGIRLYLDKATRTYHDSVLDGRIYLNAYLSRPYIIYKDKIKANIYFDMLRHIWNNREIIIVEGDKTRMGVGNNLFDNAIGVERIIAPNENAFTVYDRIVEACLACSSKKLFLIALGPTATVLAYDLYKAGYQAIDIGHVDNEYEWFLCRREERIAIKNKYVNEVEGGSDVVSVTEKPIKGIIKFIL